MTDLVRDPYGNPLRRNDEIEHDKSDTITALRAEVERLKVENIQMQAALGYGILAEDERHILPSNPFKCGTCDANKHLRAEVERLTREIDVAAEMLREAKADLKAMRAAVLEEAARIADRAVIPMCETSADHIAAAIRAMIPSGNNQ